MKLNSQFVALVIFALGVKSAREITPEMINDQVIEVLKEEMTCSACNIFADLCEEADGTCSTIYFSPNSVLWKEGGFDEMNEDVRIIFRRIQMHYGREICFEEDGMIVFPHDKALEYLRKKIA